MQLAAVFGQVLSQPKGGGTYRPHGDGVNDQGLWEAGFVVTRGWGAPISEGGCEGLVWVVPQAGRGSKATTHRRRHCLVLTIGGSFGWGPPSRGAE